MIKIISKIKLNRMLAMALVFTMPFLNSCNDSSPIINYGVEVVETEANETEEFSFEKNIPNTQKSQIMTKKDRDFMFSEEVKNLVAKRTKQPRKVKGIFLPAYVAGKDEKFLPILENIKKSCINAIVVDVKDEIGRITFNIDNDFVKSKKTVEPQIKDIDKFIKLCKDNDIYVIGRVSSFLDNYLTKLDSELAIHTKKGKYYRDNTGYYWLNPFKEDVKRYLIEIGKGCAKAGFDEIQYDYFRFSADAGMRNVVFADSDTRNRTKIEIITEFAQDIYKELIPEDIFVSIDVFGAIMNSYKDQNSIGQEYQTLLKNVDYLCPMVYPSHYANKTFGLDVPDKEPYNCVKSALDTSNKTIEKTFDPVVHYGKVRPWLQGFTANYLEEYKVYEVAEYKEQIKATEEMGFDEWLFWHPGGVYKWDAFFE